MRSIYIISTITLLLTCYNLAAQEQNFVHYSVDDGLSQSVVNCIFQDSKGFIWIGTQNGLNKFDGYTYKNYIFNANDTSSISGNWIYDIIEDKENNLWIGTRTGLNRYNRNTDNFTTFNYENIYYENLNLRIYGLDIDTKGNIIINTPPVITIYDVESNQFTHFKSEIEYESSDKNEPLPIFIDRDNFIWSSSTRGLSVLDYKNNTFEYFERNANNPNKISSDSINCFYEDDFGNIWIGTTYGLNVYNKSTKIFTKYFNNTENSNSLSSSYVHCITHDRKGNFWIGTDKGLNKMTISYTGDVVFQRFNSLSDVSSQEGIIDLMIDYSENLWIGTLQGLYKTDLKPKKFNLYRKSDETSSVDFLDNVIASIYKDDEGLIWIGNWGKGLNIYNRNTGEVKHYSSELTGNVYIPNDYVHAIFADYEKRIWIGTRSGVLVFDKNKQKFLPTQEFFNSTEIPTFENIRVNSIIQDNDLNYWFGTQNGLYKVNKNDLKTEIYTVEKESEPKLSWNYIYELMLDSEGLIWIATSNGLDVFDIKKNEITHYKNIENSTNTLCNNFVVSLCEDSEKNIWIGTNFGVNKYNKKDSLFVFYYKNNGLPGNLIYSILEDDNKNLWFATGTGLARFDKKSEIFKSYTLEEGLQSIEFNLGAKYKSSDGEVFFGGMNGINSFYPDSLNDNKYIPKMVFTGFEKIRGNTKEILNIDNIEELILDYDDNAFTIEFAALEFTKTENNKYAYIMIGAGNDEEWIEIENRRFVPFSNLPPGEYIFKVKGSNNDDVWNEEGISIKIRIKPPWWKTQLAIAIYILLLIISIVLFIKIREKKLIRERNILEEKVRIRTEELNRQKEKIEKAHEQITDSINYASRIQTAMLPQSDSFSEHFSDYFILFKPKDVVSGDFYWFKKVKQFNVFAVADCTGHGVPGAFVSMLGISLLNEIIRREEITESGQVLNELRNELKISLKQQNYQSDTKDGMDIAFCIFDTVLSTLDYSGANIPLLLIKENTNEIIEYKPSKNPIGIYYKEKDFESVKIEIKKNDVIYLFTDGYIDQFNESNGEKFKIHRLKKILSHIVKFQMLEQKTLLEEEIKEWQGFMNQIDDILIMGLKI